MAEITLIAEPGRATGTPESKRLRAAGRIPAVVYGQGGVAASVSVDARELRIALTGAAGANQLLDLQIGSEHHLTLAKVIQRHPVRNTVLHVDFQVVSRDETVSIEVPVVAVGDHKSIEQDRGVIEHVLTNLLVHAKPGNIPNEVEVDLSGLRAGDVVRVGDLRLPAGVTADAGADEVVLLVTGSAATAAEDGSAAEEGQEAGADSADSSGAATEADPASAES